MDRRPDRGTYREFETLKIKQLRTLKGIAAYNVTNYIPSENYVKIIETPHFILNLFTVFCICTALCPIKIFQYHADKKRILPLFRYILIL